MEVYEATAQAYRNGYEKGYEDGRNNTITQKCWLCEDYDRLVEIVCYLPHDNGDATSIPIDFCPKCGRKISDL